MKPIKQFVACLDRLRPYRVFERPIFIIAAPRSGSTFLFEMLSCLDETWGWHAEVDHIWWKYFPYERLKEPCDYVGPEELTPRTARALRREFYRHALWARQEEGCTTTARQRVGAARIRYLDKTIANCFHLKLLQHLFPDALYIHLVRDGRATISSMMEGWQDPKRFTKPQLQPLIPANSNVDHWAYPAPPGWQQILDRPLEEICAWSWRWHIKAANDGLRSVSERQQRSLHYERLVATPEEVAHELAEFCGLRETSRLRQFLAKPPLSRTTVSHPAPKKWRRLHCHQVARVLPLIVDEMAELGYTE